LLFPFQANTCAKGFLNQTTLLIFFTSNHWCIASNNKSTHICPFTITNKPFTWCSRWIIHWFLIQFTFASHFHHDHLNDFNTLVRKSMFEVSPNAKPKLTTKGHFGIWLYSFH
jgi:hypothetical protein